jgi:hypothetical protein
MTAPITPNQGTHAHPRLSLNGAQSYLTTAEDALDGWCARRTTKTHTYVEDGHEAIYFIDELLRELHRVRGALVDEIRVDEDERAVRVDRLLAQCRAERERRAVASREAPGLTGEASPVTSGTVDPGGAR